ncbi:nitrite reductase large subunit NirB [Pseudonocardia cypriaca]|uniref:assimilatory sulfite reductase (ferredoxin) n=1 Tax=Pseudonocardia cypriaca TaxID=882449 RepID=A0A543FT62_9PSEU|nr:nitrite reductase large subunit NirB [Pseudonocardia cypriaca]TQM37016.1 nitrite reductase (NADH) large subunit [Pseudonocardia cypriaca]
MVDLLPDDGRQHLVVIGNGMAGARAVEEILERGGAERFRITMFGDEPYGNYNRIMLSHVLAGEDAEEIYLNPLGWYADNDITLYAGVRVVRIDRFSRKVFANDGTILGYDKLIIATGSRTFFPPMDGMWVDDKTLTPGVFGFRTLDDTNAMLEYAQEHRRAVVIGGGLLGLEAAYGLQQHGLEVHVVQSGPVLMNQQLDEEAGAILRRVVERLGITVHLGKRTTAVRSAGTVSGVLFGDGSSIDCDMVVLTAGIRPNVGLGVVSGLTVERAIVTDDQMRAVDDPDIYAVGECAQHRGEVYGLVAPLWEQATVLADHITGADPKAAYHGSRIATKLKVAGVDLASMGLKHPEKEDDEFVRFSEPRRGVYKSVVIRDGKLVGATLLGDVGKVAFLTQSFDRGLPLPEERVELLFELAGPSGEQGAAEMDDSVQVCNCNGVSKGDLVACVRNGTRSVSGVMAATRAGKGCGACKGLVCDIVDWATGGDVEVDVSAGWYVPSIPMDKPTLMAACRERGLRSVSAVFSELAPDGEDAGSKMALASLLKVLWNDEYVDERDARFINDRVHANIQRDGTFSVVPQIKGGVTNAEQLRRIADVADKYAIPMIKITGGQRIDLLGVRKEDLPGVWADLDMPSGYAYGKSFRTVKTCVGTDFCRFGLGDSTGLGRDMEQRYQGLDSPAKMKLAVAGCPRNCSEALVKDVGVVAVGEDRWEVYVGGAAGASVRKGDLLATVTGRDTALRLCGTFMQYYRENARWLERTYDFVPRVGLDELKALLVDDRDGIVAGLDERMQVATDAYRDPWREGREPVTSGQFANSLPLVPLPRVPVRNGSVASNGGLPAAAAPFASGAGTADRTESGA